MTTQITAGVKVSVDVIYQPEYSNPEKLHFMFSYQITIENLSVNTIQLISRHWDIFDAIGLHKEVDGEGVVGEKPILAPGASYQYVSGCNLNSEIGYMQGYYAMQKEHEAETFNVDIPRFNLIATFKLN